MYYLAPQNRSNNTSHNMVCTSAEEPACKPNTLSGSLKDDDTKFKPPLRTIYFTTNKTGKAENRIEYANKMTTNE
jgi:hypothetical protein